MKTSRATIGEGSASTRSGCVPYASNERQAHAKLLPDRPHAESLNWQKIALALGCFGIASWLLVPGRASATEDPPGCSAAHGGLGNNSVGGINFSLAQAHTNDIVTVLPTVGMPLGACRAINAFGIVYIATGPLTNFLINKELSPGSIVQCPRDTNCQPGPYNILITPALVGAGVTNPILNVDGAAKT